MRPSISPFAARTNIIIVLFVALLFGTFVYVISDTYFIARRRVPIVINVVDGSSQRPICEPKILLYYSLSLDQDGNPIDPQANELHLLKRIGDANGRLELRPRFKVAGSTNVFYEDAAVSFFGWWVQVSADCYVTKTISLVDVFGFAKSITPESVFENSIELYPKASADAETKKGCRDLGGREAVLPNC